MRTDEPLRASWVAAVWLRRPPKSPSMRVSTPYHSQETLSAHLAHQRSEEEARRRVRRREVQHEAAQLQALEAGYKAELSAAAAKKEVRACPRAASPPHAH